jgi:hypothetical protein
LTAINAEIYNEVLARDFRTAQRLILAGP